MIPPLPTQSEASSGPEKSPSVPNAPIALVINANAGDNAAAHGADSVREALERHGLHVQVFLIDGGDPAETARRALSQGATTLIAAGGDGTVSAVASVLVNSQATLGVIPVGTLNHFAKDMQIPLAPDEAAAVIALGKVVQVDVGAVNGRIFINNSSLGVYPNIVMWREEQRKKGRNRWLALCEAVITALRRLPTLQLRLSTTDTQIARSTPLIFIGNNEYELQGVRAGTRRNLNSGHLCVYIANTRSAMQLIRLSIRALLGRPQKVGEFDGLCVKEVRVETSRRHAKVSLDGEVARLETPLNYRILPGALRVLAP